MRTKQDAERVVRLCAQREKVHGLAARIRAAESIAAHDPSLRDGHYVHRVSGPSLTFTHLAGELRELVKREAAAQIAAIDGELRALGVTPDELQDPAPDDGPVTVPVVFQRVG